MIKALSLSITPVINNRLCMGRGTVGGVELACGTCCKHNQNNR